MLHIGLRPVGARERGVQLGDAVGGEGLQLIGVEKILIGMAAAEEQHRRAELGALAPCARARSCRKPRNGASPVPGPIMIIGTRRIVGQPEAGLGLAHRGVDGVADAAAGEIVRADALVDAAPRTAPGPSTTPTVTLQRDGSTDGDDEIE